jgi:polysaccharide export outer membrane protein
VNRKPYYISWAFKHTVVSFFILCVSFAHPSLAQDEERAEAREHYRLGEIYYEHGLYKEAQSEFQKALDILERVSIPKDEEKPPIEGKKEVAAPDSAKKEYVIGRGDVLFINVWENEDLNGEVTVRPDGKISFLLIDEIQAEGRTIAQLDKDMTERLKEYIRFPDISISLQRIGGSKVIILGQIRNPGVYSLTESRSILEAIALAGGFTNDSSASSVIVIKGGLANPQAQRVNLTQALHVPQRKQNIVLESDDIVFVPKKFIADVNYFLSQVLNPIARGAWSAKEFEEF